MEKKFQLDDQKHHKTEFNDELNELWQSSVGISKRFSLFIYSPDLRKQDRQRFIRIL